MKLDLFLLNNFVSLITSQYLEDCLFYELLLSGILLIRINKVSPFEVDMIDAIADLLKKVVLSKLLRLHILQKQVEFAIEFVVFLVGELFEHSVYLYQKGMDLQIIVVSLVL